MDATKTVLTALLSVVALFIITKLMGHKQVAQLDFFDYVCGITIGSIGAELATELESPWKPLVALVVYGIVAVGLDILCQKLPTARKYINGEPTVLFSDGKICRRNLKRAKITLSELLLMCRGQGYFDLDDIQIAVLEYNGRLSVLPRAVSRPLTPADIGIEENVKRAEKPVEVIMDGTVLADALLRCGRDENWLAEQLRSAGCSDSREITLGMFHPESGELSLYTDARM